MIGSGPNGLAAAITMARAGWEVTVHEAEETVGGGVRSAELTLPGFVHDVCSAIHPLGRDSPFFRDLELPVEWIQPPAEAAHPLDDGTAVMTERSFLETAERARRGSRRLHAPLPSGRRRLVAARAGRSSARIRPRRERFLSAAASLGTGSRAPARSRSGSARERPERSSPATPRTRCCRWSNGRAVELASFLGATAHVYGWGFPRGGSQRLADALADRLRELGGEIRAGSRVDELPKADVVLADVVPRELLRIAGDRLPARYAHALRRYRYGPGVFKLDWALDGPIPWAAEECRRAATVHLGGSFEELAESERAPWEGRHPERPFVLLAQQSLFDDSRAPAGKHTAWAYCHVPNGSSEDMTDRIEAQVERFAPGFRELVLARAATGPADFERRNRNIVGGDINGGALDLGQLFFRPVRRVVPYRTPLKGLYLCSSATPPGGGVHGMCGYSAALVALRDHDGSRSHT